MFLQKYMAGKENNQECLDIAHDKQFLYEKLCQN